MSRLVARILLTVFMLPAAALVYIFAFVFCESFFNHREITGFLIGGAATWSFIAGYWLLLWRGAVQWSQQRITLTLLAVLLSLLVGVLFGVAGEKVIRYSNGSFGCFMASMASPLTWLILTVFAWRETPAERRERLRGASKNALVCPNCGYNLTGLTTPRCPECGSQFTLDELVASQPKSADVEIEA